jgi:hypothetical protein
MSTMHEHEHEAKETCVECQKTDGGLAQSHEAGSSSSVTAKAADAKGPQGGPVAPSPAIDSSSFSPPTMESQTPHITIEFCDRCRWCVPFFTNVPISSRRTSGATKAVDQAHPS